jgi:hypothetical protein
VSEANATRVASNNKGNGNGDKGGKQATSTRAMVAGTTVVGKDEVVAMSMRVVGDKEGEGGMAMAMVTRMAGGQQQQQQQGQWRWQQGWWVRMRAMSREARRMEMATKREILRKMAIQATTTTRRW